MVKCSFCNKERVRGAGKLLIQRTGKLRYYCSAKCEKYDLKLKRNPRKLDWVRKKKKAKKK